MNVDAELQKLSKKLPFKLDIELFKDMCDRIALLTDVINPPDKKGRKTKLTLFQECHKSSKKYPLTQNAFITSLLRMNNAYEGLRKNKPKAGPFPNRGLYFSLLEGGTLRANFNSPALKDVSNASSATLKLRSRFGWSLRSNKPRVARSN